MSIKKRVKVAFAGDASVGKTSIIMKYLGVKDMATIKRTKGVSIENARYRNTELIIWDFSGQEHYRDIIIPFFMGSKIVVLVFDLSEPKSLYNIIEKWANYVTDIIKDNIPVIIVGNKKDIKKMSDSFIASILEKIGEKLSVVKYFETSAITGEGINSLFDYIFEISEKYSL